MRYSELAESRPWKTYKGPEHRCLLLSHKPLENGRTVLLDVAAQLGTVWTGKTESFHGYYVRIDGPLGEWLGEDRRSMRKALKVAAEAAEMSGWTILAIGLSEDWRESGLSASTGWGSHPAYPDRHVHMLEPLPEHRSGKQPI